MFQHVRPKKIDLTPRHKKKLNGKSFVARKKIIKDVARKVRYISKFIIN